MPIDDSVYVRTRNVAKTSYVRQKPTNWENPPASKAPSENAVPKLPWYPYDGDTRGYDCNVVLHYSGNRLFEIVHVSFITKELETRRKRYQAWMPIPQCEFE